MEDQTKLLNHRLPLDFEKLGSVQTTPKMIVVI
jgi:hypothetical protein